LACAFSPDGIGALSVGWDGTMRLWDATRGLAHEEYPVSNKPLSACAVSPDGRSWLVANMEGMLAHWDAPTRQQTSVFLAHTRPVSALVFAPDGQLLASASWDRHVTLWNPDKFEGRSLGSHDDIVSGCRFTPDGKRLVSWSYDSTAAIWDVAQKRLVARLTGHDDRITAGGVSPDGNWLLTGARNGELRLWELQHGQPINSVPLPAEVRACLFLLDAESVVVVDANGRLTLHQVPSLQVIDELGTFFSVQAATRSPSGGQIALACTDGQVRFVALDGFDNSPLAVTATQSMRTSATVFQRLFGRRRVHAIYNCVCPACRTPFEVALRDGNRAHPCPRCRRSVRICAVTETAEAAVGS
jgi:WD40 repeat protein